MKNKITIHAFVSGKVQGVFYRDTVCRKARDSKIMGWVQNLADGRVELIATGEADAINIFGQWLWEGSTASGVTAVNLEEIDYTEFDEFVIKRY